MKNDEFAFLNLQLAGMLGSGIPLEGALQELCRSMKQGALQAELQALGADLAQGTPLGDAIARRRLPELYVRLVQVGARSQDLPGMLTQLADYYQRRHSIWTRLQALMVYPAIVLVGCLALSLLLSRVFTILAASASLLFFDMMEGRPAPGIANLGGTFGVWFPTLWMLAATVVFGAVLIVPSWRDAMRWRCPGLRETYLSQFAAAMRLLLRGGADLRSALTTVRDIDVSPRLRQELDAWLKRLGDGAGKIRDFAAGSSVCPPLFVWLVSQAGEDLAAGFGRAAELYAERARHRTDMMLYAALPVAVLVLGGVVMGQLFFTLRILGMLIGPMDMLGGLN